jgi:hypothetical protein
MLHETAVAWMRYRLSVTVPKKPWEETVEAYGARLRTAAAHINAHFDVDGLCRALPRRAAALIKAEGGRLAK